MRPFALAGDGIDCAAMEKILDAVHAAGFSAQAVGFGMGGGLLQKARTRACSRPRDAAASRLSAHAPPPSLGLHR